MAIAPSSSGRHLLPIVLVAMVLLVAVFIILAASAHAGAAPKPPEALYVADTMRPTATAATTKKRLTKVCWHSNVPPHTY